ncbi:MAG: hypothetical protein Q8M22_10765 [Actinomycetota bacterium]|nr:hypothetical protein [Actinomycetota bacterium]
MTATELLAVAVVLAASVVMQVVVQWAGGRRQPIGDEIEYLDRARSTDPFSPVPFLRVPLFIGVVVLSGGRERWARFLVLVIGQLAVAATSIAGALLAGPAGALSAGAVFVLLPDRWVLAPHLWPDVLLAFWQASLLALLAAAVTGTTVAPWMFGIVCAAAALTRLDSLAMLVAVSVLPLARGGWSPISGTAALWAPTVVVLGAVAVHHRRRYGSYAIDDTAAFNAHVLQVELQRPSLPVQAAVEVAWGERRSTAAGRSAERASIADLMRTPGRFCVAAVRRLHQMLGPDTFAAERLLAAGSPAYSEARPRFRWWALRGVGVGFPVLVALATAGAVASRVDRSPLIPSLVTLLAVSAVHARTRFRCSVLPALSCWAGLALVEVLHRSDRALLVLGLGVAAAVLTLRAPPRREER